MAPSITETLFALGAGPELVGVSQYSDYPPQAKKLPEIGSFLTPDIEQIVALKPTLVVGLSNSADWREIHALENMGITVLMVRENSVQDVERSIDTIAARIGRAQAARALVGRMQREMKQTEQRLADSGWPRVLMVVGHQPMVAVGPGTFLEQLLQLAHGRNIADQAGMSWPRLSIEYIIASRPQVILDGQMGNEPHAPVEFWQRYRSIPAVRDHRVFGYPDDPTLHPGPRIPQTLALLARLLHPAAFVKQGRPTKRP